MTVDDKNDKRSLLLTPFLLSTFVYPGSGQLYLKRKVLGFTIILLSSVLLVLFCIDIFGNLQRAIPVIMVEIEGMNIVQQFVFIQKFVHSELDFSKSGLYFIALLFLWLVSVLDIFLNKKLMVH